jgi:hypothetical protein
MAVLDLVSARRLRQLDAAIAAWTVAWALLAVAVAREVDGLRALSSTVVAAGVAAEEASRAIGPLEALPSVGDDVERFSERAREAGASARASGRESRDSIRDLSILLALAIGLVPTLPIALVYVPARLRWRREQMLVRRAAIAHGDDVAFRRFLARRALERLPLSTLLALDGDPWRDGRRHDDRLADAELDRLGIRRRAVP